MKIGEAVEELLESQRIAFYKRRCAILERELERLESAVVHAVVYNDIDALKAAVGRRMDEKKKHRGVRNKR